jgi:hypothetical protein
MHDLVKTTIEAHGPSYFLDDAKATETGASS